MKYNSSHQRPSSSIMRLFSLCHGLFNLCHGLFNLCHGLFSLCHVYKKRIHRYNSYCSLPVLLQPFACICRVQAHSVIIMLSVNTRSRERFICVSNRPSFVVVHAFHHFDGTLLPYLSSSLCTYQPSYVLQQQDCSKFKKQTWKCLVKVLLVTLLWLSGTCCWPTWELLPPSQLSKLT